MTEGTSGPTKLKTCGDVMKALHDRYKTTDIGTITRLSGVARSTLLYWLDHPDGPIYKRGRNHVVRIFGVDALPYGEAEGVSEPVSVYERIRELVYAAMSEQISTLHKDLVLQREEVAGLRAEIAALRTRLG